MKYDKCFFHFDVNKNRFDDLEYKRIYSWFDNIKYEICDEMIRMNNSCKEKGGLGSNRWNFIEYSDYFDDGTKEWIFYCHISLYLTHINPRDDYDINQGKSAYIRYIFPYDRTREVEFTPDFEKYIIDSLDNYRIFNIKSARNKL